MIVKAIWLSYKLHGKAMAFSPKELYNESTLEKRGAVKWQLNLQRRLLE
jgi:hypothetical protein